MKKHILITILALLLAAALPGCGTISDKQNAAEKEEDSTEEAADPFGAADDPEVTFVYAEVNPQSSITGQIAAAFQEKCEEYSGGSVHIDVQYAGVLGAEDEVLSAMFSGESKAQIARISAFNLNNQETRRTPVLSLPYTFSSREHFWKFATAPLAEVILDETDNALPIKGLFYGEEGFRNFITREPVSSIQDLAGMTIRVSDDPVMQSLVKGLGAEPIYIPFTELYPALQHKVVDAAEQPIINYQSNMLPEVALNLLLDEHTLGVIEVIITNEAWEEMTEAQQQAMMAACAYAQEINKKSIEDTEQTVLEELRKNGVNIIEVSDEDKDKIKKVCEDTIEEYTQGVTAELYNKIRELK